MNKEFIPYEQALELKELGFDEPCFGYYYTLDGKDWKFADDKQYDSLDEFYNIGSKFTISAPTFSQAFRWFREKHDLDSYIMPARLETKKVYDYYIWFTNQKEERDLIIGMNNQYTYEEAELKCLKKLIEIANEK